ncbi:hypothetical protein Tco_1532941 [Tanacetum coccineum]
MDILEFCKELEAQRFGAGTQVIGIQLLQLELRLGKAPSRSFRPLKSGNATNDQIIDISPWIHRYRFIEEEVEVEVELESEDQRSRRRRSQPQQTELLLFIEEEVEVEVESESEDQRSRRRRRRRRSQPHQTELLLVRCAPFEALNGRKCRLPIMWAEIGEGQLIGFELVQETTEKISQIKNRLKAARDRQKKPVEILEKEFKKLKRSRIAIVKVWWNLKCGPEFTWERKDQMKLKYPHLFSDDSS